jgi:tetratricopeptide (TPR) repeat protein
VAERPLLLAEWFRFRFAQYPAGDNYAKLRDFIANQPEDVETAIALVRWSLRQRQLGWARTLLEQVFAQRPDKLDARAGLAECHMELGNGPAVEQLLAEWPKERQEARYWSLCGRWQQEFARDYNAAVASFERLLAEQPDDWQSRFRLANCLRILDRNDEADRETREAERIRDVTRFEKVRIILDSTLQKLNRPENRFEMGEFYRSVGYTREAKAWYGLALALDSQHEPTREAIRTMEAAN